ncbi:MAG: VWA domain-containing protein [Dehalococcoidales bacterium]|nr:VWA domain-containing protein [Dehalococcoidales bacterium]
MGNFIYSEWDGSQELFDLDTDQIMDELGKHIFQHGNLSQALRALQRRGLNSQSRQMPSLDKLLERLRRMKQERLNQYNLDSVMDEIKQKLDKILDMERQGIQQKVDEVREKAESGDANLAPEVKQRLLKNIEDRAAQNREKLDSLPPDTPGRIKELTDYDFMDEEAREQFQELMDMLKKHAMEQFGKDLVQRLKNMDPAALAGMRNMIEALNQMMEQQMRGESPDFNGFMEQFGSFFGDNPPQNLEELVENLQNQIAQGQSLMNSLSPEARQELQKLLDSMLDDATKYELARMASYLERLYPSDELQRHYPFSGEESVSYDEAMKLMEALQKMERLEQQMKEAQYDPSMDSISDELVKEVMGEEAERELESLQEIARLLEEAGYISRRGDKYELTPKGMRKIGQQALSSIFSRLKEDRFGGHNINNIGPGGERIEETKKYEFGDDFHIHIQKTVMNSLKREAASFPLKLDIEDFEILKAEETTRSATVLMLDRSLSMFMNGYFESAKQVAIALDSLIRTRFPKDVLHVLTFSRRAREVKGQELLFASSTWGEQGTNYQDALRLARKLLTNQNCSNKQIILVTDGEPTAHLEGDRVYFQYPPSLRTLQKTVGEVRACTAQRIVINTFMFEDSPFLTRFITQIARLNKGRIFFTSPTSLGKYVLMDYLSNKHRKIG